MSGVSNRMKTFKLYLLIGIGGALVSLARYSVSIITFDFFQGSVFPIDTFITNLCGCFFLSFLLYHYIKEKLSDDYFQALTVGILGSFTTFSTVMVETITLWSHHLLLATLYIGLSILGGLLFCYIGYKLAM